ncbi:HdeD family acid-resistance protein [Rhodopseudomonas boonkerdii]|uniref:HdeD family acid-resistance protein n=1 Tax=Rhodopseudomonas boonkerdii TaxID=475937 RepID=UPI001E3C3D83|nr:HdeD family acid-resistance protein [Rhodopseudomonas boonkerdii]UGV27675.1 HdeD family acid-resistance protein [Rhodopseudomonas boonkerdii]
MTDAGKAHSADANSNGSRSVGDVTKNAREKWAWFVALGALMVLLGAVAMINLAVTTIATVIYIGVLMLIGGAFQCAQAFKIKTWSGFGWWLLSGALYGTAGITTVANPLLASYILTLILAAFTLAAGISRIIVGLRTKPNDGWTIHAASGLITTVVGFIFLLGWPVNSLWLLGLLLSVDLLFQGCMCLAFGMRLKLPPHSAFPPGAT